MANPRISYTTVFRDGIFKDDVALVTGGGTGIGRCIAHELARLGCTVAIAGRNLDRLLATAEEINALNPTSPRVRAYQLNIRDSDAVVAVIEKIVKDLGNITCLVNNAGGQFPSPAANMTMNGWKTVVDLNLNGTWAVTRAVFDACMREYGGKIVNVVADMFQGFPMMAHTGAARAAVVNLTQTLAVEWGNPYGIRINAVAPGTIISSGMKNYPPTLQENVVQSASYQNPSARLGTESEVSAAVVFLFSPAAAYINGATLRVDGGSSLLKGFEKEMMFPERKSKIPAFVGYPEDINTDVPENFQELLKEYVQPKL